MEIQFIITIKEMYPLIYIHAPLHPENCRNRNIPDRIFIPAKLIKVHGDFPPRITIRIVPRNLREDAIVIYKIFCAEAVFTGVIDIVTESLCRQHQQHKAIIPPHISQWECRSIYI